jgi:SAM-dependent methyltransferase
VPIRILDVGCGNCELISYLEAYVPDFNKDLDIEVYGFDVTDSKVQFKDYFDKAFQMLTNRHSHINWETRLRIIKSEDTWPFDDNFFDIVLSNQVVEHVHDHGHFFRRIGAS